MKKKELIEHIAEKARISAQRAELAYDAFWEAILSELKTGHFSLPFGTGTINIKSKGESAIKDFKASKPKDSKLQKAAKKQPVSKKKAVAKTKPVAAKKKVVAKKTAKSKKKK